MMADRAAFIAGCNQLKITKIEQKTGLIDRYVGLLRKWNKTYNLVAPSTLDEVYKRHILDSAQLIPHLKVNDKIIDLGSGAGLPAVILCVLADVEVHAVERRDKKCQFLHEVRRQLGLNDKLFIHNQDIAALSVTMEKAFSVVTSRAFSDIDTIFSLGQRFLNENGEYLLHKSQGELPRILEVASRNGMTVDIKESISFIGGRILEIRRST